MFVLTVPHSVCDDGGECSFEHKCDFHAPYAAKALERSLVKHVSPTEVRVLHAQENRCTSDNNRAESRDTHMRTSLRGVLAKENQDDLFVIDVHSYPKTMPHEYKSWENYDLVMMVPDRCTRVFREIHRRFLSKHGNSPGVRVKMIAIHPLCDIVNECTENGKDAVLLEFNERQSYANMSKLCDEWIACFMGVLSSSRENTSTGSP